MTKKETTTVVNGIWRRYWLRAFQLKSQQQREHALQSNIFCNDNNQPNNMKRYKVFLDNAADLKCKSIRMDFILI